MGIKYTSKLDSTLIFTFAINPTHAIKKQINKTTVKTKKYRVQQTIMTKQLTANEQVQAQQRLAYYTVKYKLKVTMHKD